MDWSRRAYTKETFIDAWESAKSISDVALSLGLNPTGGAYKSIRVAAIDLGLSDSHMSRKSSFRNPYSIPMEQILVENSTYSSTTGLKKRLIANKTLAEICVGCGATEAFNFISGKVEKIKLQLDHINGVSTDNRIENLRLLCPTCHSFTPTYCGGNNKGKKTLCLDCSKEISHQSKRCQECKKKFNYNSRRLAHISTEDLIAGVQALGYSAYAKSISISCQGLRKEFDRRGILRPAAKYRGTRNQS